MADGTGEVWAHGVEGRQGEDEGQGRRAGNGDGE